MVDEAAVPAMSSDEFAAFLATCPPFDSLNPDDLATAVAINVICPHTLTSRPLVLPEKARIALRILRGPSPLSFSADGQICASLAAGNQVEIRLARKQARLVMLPDHDDFATLRQKLNWNGTVLH